VLSTVRSRHDPDAAADYAAASRAAVDEVAAIAAAEAIECDLERMPACTYAATEDEVDAVEEEAKAAAEAGLPVELTAAPGLPFDVPAAVVLPDQLQFHPVKYCLGLARAIEGDGCEVFEGSRATGMSARSPYAVSAANGTVIAEHVVVATHYPVFDRGLYFARLEAQRSYCVAAPVEGRAPGVMAISAGSPTRSIRSYGPGTLIVGGEGHPAGSRDASQERFRRLEEFAREHWAAGEISHRWSAQDPVPYDHLPMVGAYLPGQDRLLVSTGFMKWGLTGGTFAAMIIRDLIAGDESPWAERFGPNRVSLRSLPDVGRLGAKFGADMVADRLRPGEATSPSEVPVGEGGVVRQGASRYGVYRDLDGTEHVVSLRCTHLGCLLRWNGAERSWDCPCHGSRFGVDGEVLEGPAVHPLASGSDALA
jgi:glycine/D-amino acid oxidase-like deaminating enzyme/nitrite reductase/ring-hydroxylating ferredoxin subunit